MKYKTTLWMIMGMLNLGILHPFYAQVPQLINYQGLLKEDGGDAVSGVTAMTFFIYDAETDGNVLWTETQNVMVAEGLFHVLLGTVELIPYSVFNGDDRYFTLSVGSDPEMSPRQRLVSVGYAFRSQDTNHLDGYAAGDFLRSIDGVQPNSGNIDLVEGNNITIDRDEDNHTITISTTTGEGGALTLPYAGLTETGSTAFSVTTTGTGSAGSFKISNSENANTVLYGETNGTGRVGHFRITNSENMFSAMSASTTGDGPALSGYTTGSGAAINGRTDGIGHAGHFEITSEGNASHAVNVTTIGSGCGIYSRSIGANSYSVYGMHLGSGNHGFIGGPDLAVFGYHQATQNRGVLGSSPAGVYGLSVSQIGVWGISESGTAVHGSSTSGTAVYAEGDLFVDGAFRGNIGPNNGAPFPRPAYDSGWIQVSNGRSEILNHDVGGNPDDYFVDMQFMSDHSSGRHNEGIGFYEAYSGGSSKKYGVYWKNLTDESITLVRASSDKACDEIRIRIWVCQ